MVKIRIAGSSYAGQGLWSHTNDIGARVRRSPQQMSRPFENTSIKKQGQFQNSIFIEWNKLTTPNETGNSYIFEYILKTDARNNEYKEVYRGLDTSHIIYKPRQGTTYSFRVQARNVYGFGPLSDPLTVQTGSPPGPMQPIIS